MNAASPRAIPSVDRLLAALEPHPLPRTLVTRVIRKHLAALRSATIPQVPSFAELVAQLRAQLETLAFSRLQPVINATGILAHTNLGRAPLSLPAASALNAIAPGYSNLEFDLPTGQRGQRGAYLESAIALLCEAEDATVVNNGAAALVLVLRHLIRADRNEVVISRGELVQIGGGFRIPDILETSGARLREVGTTNRTTTDDYRAAIGPATALILKVHRSNFFMEGFVESPDTASLVSLAREHAVPFVEDLGSGALVDIADLAPVAHEPQPQETLRAGADLVCFSADKLLGGPQAGIIVGRASWIQELKRDPFFRALRCDKLTFAALQATLETYLQAQSGQRVDRLHDIPMLAMMQASEAELRNRADAILLAIADLPATFEAGAGKAQVGGGVCPRSTLPSVTLRCRPKDCSLEQLAARLRLRPLPIVGFIAENCFQLDLRTVFPSQDSALIHALREVLTQPQDGAGELGL